VSLRRFASLMRELSEAAGPSARTRLIAEHLGACDDATAAWTMWFLRGRHLRRAVAGSVLRRWAAARADISEHLAGICHDHVGDLAETLTLLVAATTGTRHPRHDDPPLAEFIESSILPLSQCHASERQACVEAIWDRLDEESLYAFHKLLTGAFRLGVAAGVAERGAAQALGVEVDMLRERLAGGFEPTPEQWRRLSRPPTPDELATRPLPFQLAHGLETTDQLGPVADHLVESKWDGVRAQLIHREVPVLVGRGEGRLDAAFPELIAAAARLPRGVVLDGEVLLVDRASGRPRPFTILQRRLGTTHIQTGLFDPDDVVFMAFDLLEIHGEDLRERSLEFRRAQLQALTLDSASEIGDGAIRISPTITIHSWAHADRIRSEARLAGVEGLMVKRRDAPYTGGRTRGSWWKWKTDPRTIDAVLVHTQGGHGRRAGLLTDHTLALWDGEELVPVARAYSGLTDAEMTELDRLLKRTVVARRGPVRILEPSIVLEIAFDGVQTSTRHRSGVALRFPRIARWRRDKTPADANRLEELKALLPDADRGPSPPDRASPPPSSD
jgi:DNA ligase-1